MDEVERIIDGYSEQYGSLQADLNQVKFDDISLFSVSYLGMVRNLHYSDY
jgi:hypothetical protein